MCKEDENRFKPTKGQVGYSSGRLASAKTILKEGNGGDCVQVLLDCSETSTDSFDNSKDSYRRNGMRVQHQQHEEA